MQKQNHKKGKDMKTYLFVYGSMKKGFKNQNRLEDDKLIGISTTRDKYSMYPAKTFNYPYLLEDEKKWQIDGELYELITTNISKIDMFEGVPDHYYRKQIEVYFDNQIYKAFIYFRTPDNPIEMDEIALNEWTKEFEKVGIKHNEYMDTLKVALLKKAESLEAQLFRTGS